MGKSTKKAKSDRINALRKQYDAFLEEDKKRKERNEYILGRLDNMRYSNALVPVRHKPNTQYDNHTVVMQQKCSSIRDFQYPLSNQNQHTTDIPVKNYEDTFLIQEISKKYILIPKFRSTFMNNCIKNVTHNQTTESVQELHPLKNTISMADVNPNTNENTDWKSKYEILNILKNEENKKDAVKFSLGVEEVSNPNANKQSLLRNNENQVADNYNNNINTGVNEKTPHKYLNELPEKDLSYDAQNYELKTGTEYSPNNVTYANSNTYNENHKDSIVNVDESEDIDYKLQQVKLDYSHSEAANLDPPLSVSNIYEKEPENDIKVSSTVVEITGKQSENTYSENTESESVYPTEINSELYDQNNVVGEHKSAQPEQVGYLDGDESPIRVENSIGLANAEQNDLLLVGDTDCKDSIEVGNVQELTPPENNQMKTEVNIQDKVENKPNIDPVHELHEDPVKADTEPVFQTENLEDVCVGIADFEVEQREMFYSDQIDENVTHQPDDNALHPGYSQNENQHSQENAYYEPIPQEVYPVEINDHEVTQQYDPYYAQQYANVDEDQQQYQQQPAQYQEHEGNNDLPEPKLELQQYEQEHFDQDQVEGGYMEQEQLAETFDGQHAEENLGIEQSGVEEIQAYEQNMG